MRVDSIKFGATIPTGRYANIQPEITLVDIQLEKSTEIGMKFISDLYAKYSEKGGLIPKEIIIATSTKKSFNEDIEINYDPLPHTYHYEGKKLVSATEYIKRFYKPFDAETISEVSAKSWGVKQQEVKDLWQMNGELTADLGTVIHKALELYVKYQELGQKISDKRGMDGNYAMPKHPLLKSIIEGFIEIDKSKGKIAAEVLVTDIKKGMCGHADRVEIIDLKKKICRVQDFKININSEDIDKYSKVLAPFDSLPANKLSKYQLQMSIYANMLQEAGWTVEGLDVFVYEDCWKHYKLDVLKVI